MRVVIPRLSPPLREIIHALKPGRQSAHMQTRDYKYAAKDNTYKVACALSEDSDQHGLPSCLMFVFVIGMEVA